MTTLKIVWSWLTKYGALVALVVGGAIGFLLRRPKLDVKAEVAGVRAQHDAEVVMIREGREAAIVHVEETHGAQVEALNQAEKAQAVELADDPVALAKLLARAGARTP